MIHITVHVDGNAFHLFLSPLPFFLSYFLFFIHTCLITSSCLYTQTAEDRDIDFYPVSAILVVRDMEKLLCSREVMYVIKGTVVPSFS